MLERYCVDCHEGSDAEAGMDLSAFERMDQLFVADDGLADASRVAEMIRFAAMPPEDSDLPTADERAAMADLLESAIRAVGCDLDPRPGHVTARRLNRGEYRRAVRDLFGFEISTGIDFPSDEVGAGFDNNGDILSISPLLMEKYLDAAQSIAAQVVIDERTLPRLERDVPADQLWIFGPSRTGSFFGRYLASGSMAAASYDFPYDGQYEVEVYAGVTEKKGPRTRLAICDDDGNVLAVTEHKYFGGGGRSDRETARIEAEAGEHLLFAVPIHDDGRDLRPGVAIIDEVRRWTPKEKRSAAELAEASLKVDRDFEASDFPFMVRRLKVEGPKRYPNEVFPPSQSRLTRKMPSQKDGRYVAVATAATQTLQPIMRSAFRRQIEADEVEKYAELVAQQTEVCGDYYEGLRAGIAAILVSPNFLFRIEPDVVSEPEMRQAVRPLRDTELASRLSFFLYSSIPDPPLLEDAIGGRLDDKSVHAHVERMLADERSDALAEEFAEQWLGLRNLQNHRADAERYGDLDAGLKSSMIEETRRLFLHVLREDLPLSQLLLSDISFLDERLRHHYGIDDGSGAKDRSGSGSRRSAEPPSVFRAVRMDSHGRRGLLSHASILTLTSNPDRTSPVKRGKWILENILGSKPPDPPPGVPELEAAQTTDHLSLREQLEVHRRDPGCAACHRVMDQLGFGMERFDAVGRIRHDITDDDCHGELVGGQTFRGPRELTGLLAASEMRRFATTVTRRMMTFAIGRELTSADRCHVETIVDRCASSDYRLSSLIHGIVDSPSMRQTELRPLENSGTSKLSSTRRPVPNR